MLTLRKAVENGLLYPCLYNHEYILPCRSPCGKLSNLKLFITLEQSFYNMPYNFSYKIKIFSFFLLLDI